MMSFDFPFDPAKFFFGIAAALLGAFFLYQSAGARLPALESLTVVEAPLSGLVREQKEKNGSYVRVPLGAVVAQARYGCGTGPCIFHLSTIRGRSAGEGVAGRR